MTHDPTGPTREDAQTPDASRRPTDAEVRGIAEQLVREVREPPAASPGHRASAQAHELSAADEERVDEALVALGAAEPEDTLRAEREAQAGEAPEASHGDPSDAGGGAATRGE